MAFNLPEYYQRNAGTIFIADRNLATGGAAASGLTFIGDASELTLDPSQEFVEHTEHQSGDGRKDVKIPRMTTLTGNLVLDNTGAKNMQNFLRGKLTTLSGATVTNEAHTAPAVGQAFLLNSEIVTAVGAITERGSTAAYAAGTDYIANGRVIFVPEGSTLAGEEIDVDYTSGSGSKVDLFGETFKEYYLYFNGYNTINKKRVAMELFKVSFDPATLGNLLGDEILQMTIAFEVLFEELKATSNDTLGGFGTYVYQN
jgi:hypothetical protein